MKSNKVLLHLHPHPHPHAQDATTTTTGRTTTTTIAFYIIQLYYILIRNLLHIELPPF